MQLTRALTAEFLGTFALVFIGAGAVVTDSASGGQLGLVGVALAHGIVLAVMVTAAMRISGGHLNPAVTTAVWLARRIDGPSALLYVAIQLVAGVTAALLVKALFPVGAGMLTAYGVPRIASDVSFLQAIVIEAILTLFLVSAVFGTAVSPNAPRIAGFGIGLAVTADILVGGPLTGAAMNPARWLGPAVAALWFDNWYVYWIGPLLGGAIAGLSYRYLFASETQGPG